MDVRRKAVAALTAAAGLLVAVLVALAGLGPAFSAGRHDTAPFTARAASGATARVVGHQPGALVAHQVRSERDAGSGPGDLAACPPWTGVTLPLPAGAVAPVAAPAGGPWRATRCVDGRAPPAAQPLAVPLSLG